MKRGAIVSAILLMLIGLAPGGATFAQPPAPPPPSEDAAAAGTQPEAADTWNFAEDEDQEPTWRQIVGAQATDLVLFPAFVTLALVGFFRKSVRLKYITLAASVVYLGIFRSQLISVVNIFGVLSWNLPIFKYSI